MNGNLAAISDGQKVSDMITAVGRTVDSVWNDYGGKPAFEQEIADHPGRDISSPSYSDDQVRAVAGELYRPGQISGQPEGFLPAHQLARKRFESHNNKSDCQELKTVGRR
jgi:hypothetical protein